MTRVKKTYLILQGNAQRLRIDVAGRAKVEAPVQFAATSIRVELSCFGEVKELLGDYVMNASPRQSLESILIKRLYKEKCQRSRSWRGMVMRISSDFSLEGKQNQGCCEDEQHPVWRVGRGKEAIVVDNVRWAEWSVRVSWADHRWGRKKPGGGWLAKVSGLAGLGQWSCHLDTDG